MEFEWDEAKHRANQRKHSVVFETAALVFFDEFAYYDQDRFVAGEERWQVIGEVQGHILLVAYVYLSEEAVRIISARKATRKERNCDYAHGSSQA